MINFYGGNCLTHLPRKAQVGRVDYRSLSTSFFSKNLIIPEAAYFQKVKVLQ
jgi:hypothetical protein